MLFALAALLDGEYHVVAAGTIEFSSSIKASGHASKATGPPSNDPALILNDDCKGRLER